MKKKSLVISAMLLLGTSCYAQKRFNVNAHLAPSAGAFKTGSYDDFSTWGSVTLGDPNGFAGTGIGLGLDYRHAIQDKGLSLVFGIDAYRTPVKRIIRKSFKSDESFETGESTIKFSSYYNIAPKLGLQYGLMVNENIELYTQVTIAYDILKISGSEYRYNIIEGWTPTTKTYDFNLSGAFGFGFRVGMAFNDSYTVSLAYKNLGKHLIQRTFYGSSVSGEESYDGEDQKNISMLNLSVGLLF